MSARDKLSARARLDQLDAEMDQQSQWLRDHRAELQDLELLLHSGPIVLTDAGVALACLCVQDVLARIARVELEAAFRELQGVVDG